MGLRESILNYRSRPTPVALGEAVVYVRQVSLGEMMALQELLRDPAATGPSKLASVAVVALTDETGAERLDRPDDVAMLYKQFGVADLEAIGEAFMCANGVEVGKTAGPKAAAPAPTPPAYPAPPLPNGWPANSPPTSGSSSGSVPGWGAASTPCSAAATPNGSRG